VLREPRLPLLNGLGGGQVCGEKFIKVHYPEIEIYKDSSRYHKKWVLSIIHRRSLIFAGIFVIFGIKSETMDILFKKKRL
jgi:hypothetical protein